MGVLRQRSHEITRSPNTLAPPQPSARKPLCQPAHDHYDRTHHGLPHHFHRWNPGRVHGPKTV